jgi:pSer/pThr/pTyr-binding forkhead associated (FHA) protein
MSMTRVNLRVIQGADRGKIYTDLKLPITIGREDGNAIQLNDERISRYHVKILEDNQYVVLTDLDSTNGTRVNGQDCQLRILRYGDVISIGRSVLLYGTRSEIADRVQESLTAVEGGGESAQSDQADGLDFDLKLENSALQQLQAKITEPKIPERLTPSQAAQLSEMLEYFHQQFSAVVEQVKVPELALNIKVDIATWQLIVEMHSRVGEIIRSISEPNG